MLKEFMENVPLSLSLSIQEFQKIFVQETFALVYEKSGVDLSKNFSVTTSAEIAKVVEVMAEIYKKIFANTTLPPENKFIVLNLVTSILFDLWRNSSAVELFFARIRQNFSNAQIILALFAYVRDFNNHQWVTSFFTTHKQMFFQPYKKIRTIGIYYPRIFDGGTERFIAAMIPIYINLGYRVALFTDFIKPELEYPTPPISERFQRIVLSTPTDTSLQKLQEFEMYIKRYEIDLMISHYTYGGFVPFVQMLLFRLSGVKMIFQIHMDITTAMYKYPEALNYAMTDAVINLSRMRRQFWRNLGVRAYYVPNPVTIPGNSNPTWGGGVILEKFLTRFFGAAELIPIKIFSQLSR